MSSEAADRLLPACVTDRLSDGTGIRQEHPREGRVWVGGPPIPVWLGVFVAFHPACELAVIRNKDAEGLAEWRSRRWVDLFQSHVPIIVDVSDSVLGDHFQGWDVLRAPLWLVVRPDRPPFVTLDPTLHGAEAHCITIRGGHMLPPDAPTNPGKTLKGAPPFPAVDTRS